MDTAESLASRITELELRWMQVQRDFDALNSVVIQQQLELETLRVVLGRFETRLESVLEPEPTRDPLAERPPHY